MDTTNCSSLYVTDLVLRPGPALLEEVCTSNFVPWLVIMLILLLLSAWIAFQRTILHLKRTKDRLVPWIVVLSWASTLVLLLFTFLPFVGLSATNGGTLFLFGLLFVMYGVKSMLLLTKLIKLGRKIIPLSRKFVLAGDDAVGSDKKYNLSTMNSVLAVLFVVSIALMAGQAMCLFILVFVLPQQIERLITIAFGMVSLFLALQGISIVYQFERCIQAVKSPFTMDGVAVLSPEGRLKLIRTIRRMRLQQLASILLNTPTTLYIALVSASVIPRTYAVLLGILAADIVTNATLVFIQLSTTKSNRKIDLSNPRESNRATPPGVALSALSSPSSS